MSTSEASGVAKVPEQQWTIALLYLLPKELRTEWDMQGRNGAFCCPILMKSRWNLLIQLWASTRLGVLSRPSLLIYFSQQELFYSVFYTDRKILSRQKMEMSFGLQEEMVAEGSWSLPWLELLAKRQDHNNSPSIGVGLQWAQRNWLVSIDQNSISTSLSDTAPLFSMFLLKKRRISMTLFFFNSYIRNIINGLFLVSAE